MFFLAQLKKRLKRAKQKIYYLLFRLPTVSIDDIAPPLEEPIELITEQINLPPRLGWPHDDVTPLMRIIRAINPQVVLELGTGRGNTTANICAMSDAHVYTVNALSEQISGTQVTFVLTKEEIGRVYREYGFQDRVTQLHANTMDLDLLHHIHCPCVDLAIIDACHDREYVINDFLKSLPVLRDNAIVLFHDTHPSRKGHLAGSYDACVILRRRGFDIKHLADTWWAIWRKRTW